jgi:hypothetical protein
MTVRLGSSDRASLHRNIIAGNIDRDPVGRQLTPEARERAIDFGVNAWKGNMGNGTASDLGIKHVTSDVFKNDK